MKTFWISTSAADLKSGYSLIGDILVVKSKRVMRF